MQSRYLVCTLVAVMLMVLSSMGMASDGLLHGALELSAGQDAWLKAHPVIRVGIMSAWPPLDYVDRAGQPSGIGVDYIRALNTRLNNALTIVPGPFHESMASVKAGQLDAMMDITPKRDREAWFHFTRPYLVIPHVLVGRKNGPYFRTAKDLAGKTVALEKGGYNVTYFHDNYPWITVTEYPNTSRALGAVARGEADAYAGNRAVVIYLIEKELMPNLQIQGRLDKSPEVLSVGVRKDWPELAAILNKAFLSLTIDEERQIRQRWLDHSEPTLTPQELPVDIEFHGMRFVLKSILVVFSIILLASFLVWMARGRPRNLSLRAILFGVSLVFTGMIVAICTFVLLLLQMEKKMADIEIRKYESLRLAYELKQSSDDLTRFARTFAVTGEFRFKSFYMDVIAIREGQKAHPGNRVPSYWDHVTAGTMDLDESGDIYSMAEKMDELGLSPEEQELLARAKKDSDDLVTLETAAMNGVEGLFKDDQGKYTVVGEPDRETARQLLNGQEYHLAKSKIMKSIDDFSTLLEWRNRNELNLLQQKTLAVLTAITVLTILTILFAIFSFFLMKRRIISPLYRLKSGATVLKDGDYTHHINIRSDDEVGDLARAFNAMADSIKERTAKLRSIIETAIDAIIVISQSGRIQEFSPAAQKMFGYDAEEVMGQNISLLMTEQDRDRHDEFLSGYLAKGENRIVGKRFETRGLKKDGGVFSISISVSGAMIGGKWQFTGIIRDITQRKLIEEARQLSLKMNQMTDTASEEEIVALGLEACVRLSQSSIGHLCIIGPDREIQEGLVWSDQVLETWTVDENQADNRFNPTWKECLQGKAPVIHDSGKDTPGKKDRELAVPVMDSGGSGAVICVGNKAQPYGQYDIDIVSMLLTNLWGIIRRKKAAKLLKENEERLNLVLKGGKLGYWDVDFETRETIVNRRWARLLGYPLEEVDDAYEIWKSSLHPEDREQVLAAGKEYLSGQTKTYEIEYRTRTRSGETRWQISRGAVMERDRFGKPRRMAGTVLDITEKKVIEEELRQNMEDLKRFSNIAIGREEKMISLKDEINGLLVAGGKEPRYRIVE